MYNKNPQFKDLLLVALMHVFMSKINGQSNPTLPPKALNFYIARESLSRKTFDLVYGDLLGPALRSVQIFNTKIRGSTIIECDSTTTKEQVKTSIKIIRDDFIKSTFDKDTVIEFSLGFDGTKVLSILQVEHANKVVVGGVSSSHFIDISGKIDA